MLPLEELIEKYNVYHEMDISAIFELFMEKEKEESILSKILKNRMMKTTKLASITGIPLASINYYKKDNQNIYKANYTTVKKIASALNVEDRIFLAS